MRKKASVLPEVERSMKRFLTLANKRFRGENYRRVDTENNFVIGSEKDLGFWKSEYGGEDDDYKIPTDKSLEDINEFFMSFMKKQDWYDDSTVELSLDYGEKNWMEFAVILKGKQASSQQSRTAGDECSDKTKTMDYVKCRAEKMEKEQGYPVDKAFATAWSIACKHKKLPDSGEHCQKKPSEYFPKKKKATNGETIMKNRKNAGVEDMFSKPHESVRTFVGEDDLLGTEDYQEMLAEEMTARFEKGKPADPTENMSPEDKKKWNDEKVNKDNWEEKLKGKKAGRSVRESEMEEGKVYKGTFGTSTWHFKPTASASKSGKVKGLIMGSDDKKPKSAFIGKKTGWDGVEWEEASDAPSKMKSATENIMAGHTPESFKQWCKDNPDACAEWQENTEKYKDVVKDQHKKADCGCDGYQVFYVQPEQPDYFEDYVPEYFAPEPEPYSPLDMSMYEQMLGLPRFATSKKKDVIEHQPLTMDMYEQMLGSSRFAKPIHQKQYEEANTLSGVDPQIAAIMVQSGNGETDKVSVVPAKPNAVSLHPSQTTMRIKQSVGMALGMLRKGKIGGNLGAIISKDNHIMDGHHRWAAAILAGGSKAKVGGYQADENGEVLIRILNILTKGYFGVRNGKKGTGNIQDFNKAKTEEVLRDFVANGVGGEHPFSAEEVQSLLKKAYGSVEKGIKVMSGNADLISKKIPSWAPARKEMPVIKKDQLPEAVSVLNKGQVDWSPTYVRASGEKVADNVEQILKDNEALIESLNAQTKIIKDLF